MFYACTAKFDVMKNFEKFLVFRVNRPKGTRESSMSRAAVAGRVGRRHVPQVYKLGPGTCTYCTAAVECETWRRV